MRRFLEWCLQFSANWSRYSVGRRTLQEYGRFSTGVYLGLIAVAFFWCYTWAKKDEDGRRIEHSTRSLWNVGIGMIFLLICPGIAHLFWGNYPADTWQMGIFFPSVLFSAAGGALLYGMHMKDAEKPWLSRCSFVLLAVILLIANVSQPVRFAADHFRPTVGARKVSAETIAVAELAEGRTVIAPKVLSAELGELDGRPVAVSNLGRMVDDTAYKDVFGFAAWRCELLVVSKECMEASELTLEELDAYALTVGFALPVEAASARVYEWHPEMIPPQE